MSLAFVPLEACVCRWGLGAARGPGPRRSPPIPGKDERHDVQLNSLDAVFRTQYASSLSFPCEGNLIAEG